MRKLPGLTVASNLVGTLKPTGALTLAVDAAATASVIADLPLKIRSQRISLVGQTISVLAANDFGSLKVVDLPNTNLYVIGVALNITFTCSGFASNNGTALDISIGTAAEASDATLDSTQADVIAKVDGTGTTTGSAIGVSAAPFQVAKGASNAWYINVADPVTSGTGVITISAGYIDVTYVDLSA